jgi:hypothetical protein
MTPRRGERRCPRAVANAKQAGGQKRSQAQLRVVDETGCRLEDDVLTARQVDQIGVLPCMDQDSRDLHSHAERGGRDRTCSCASGMWFAARLARFSRQRLDSAFVGAAVVAKVIALKSAPGSLGCSPIIRWIFIAYSA